MSRKNIKKYYEEQETDDEEEENSAFEESYEEENQSYSLEETEDEDAEKIKMPRKRAVRKISDSSDENSSSESEKEREDVEEVHSPQTRLSITGYRSKILTSDESLVEESENESESDDSKDEEESTENINKESNSLLDNEANDSSESTDNSEKQDTLCENSTTSLHSISKNHSGENESTGDISEEEISKGKTERSTQESEDTDNLDVEKEMGRRSVAPRYTEIFNRSIKEKLSSTAFETDIEKHLSTHEESVDKKKIVKQKSNDMFDNDSSSNEETVLHSFYAENPMKYSVGKENEKNFGNNIIELSSDDDSIKNKMKSKTEKNQSVSSDPSLKVVEDESGTKNSNEPIFVSREHYDEKLQNLQLLKADRENCIKLINTCAKQMPDKGQRLIIRKGKLDEEIQKLIERIAKLRVKNEPVVKIKAVPTWEELAAGTEAIQPKFTGKIGLAKFSAQKALTMDRLKDIHGSLENCPAENILAKSPRKVKTPLMDHQRYALTWMHWRESQKPRGGILADDMGLGKTLTMISLLLSSIEKEAENHEYEKSEEEDESEDDGNSAKTKGWCAKGRKDYSDGGCLVVCPASLVQQWEEEVRKHTRANSLSVCVHHGARRETRARDLSRYDLVITTYTIMAREKKVSGPLVLIKWKRIILDEAHIVRNHKSQTSEAVCSLKGKYRWVLTGTPIQNKELDLYALLKFLKCSPFDDLSHWKRWVENKSAGGQQRLNTLMKSLMLRRTKAQLQTEGKLDCLPDKTNELIEVKLETDEMNVYQKVLLYSKSLFAQFLHQREEKGLGGGTHRYRPTLNNKQPEQVKFCQQMYDKMSRLYGSREIKSYQILVLLLRLRQICDHPGLIDAMLEDDDTSGIDEDNPLKEFDLLRQLNDLKISDNPEANSSDQLSNSKENHVSNFSQNLLVKSNPVFNLNRLSSKLKSVLDILQNKVLPTEDKVVIVSQWTSVLITLESFLKRLRLKTISLTGQTPVQARQDVVNKFNDPNSQYRILLLSLTAGGVGLNLTGGNHLFLIDMHWNPQLETQAQDRIYRVGQKKTVHVYRFLCKDTVEERIKGLQDHKIELAQNILTGVKPGAGSKLTLDELKRLFDM